MAFSPFEGVLLDDPREPIPGSLAVLLHLRVERQLAAASRRSRLSREAVLDRSRACQELLRQGLLPGQLRGLAMQGLRLGNLSDGQSLASLLSHFETYLAAVDEVGFLEPYLALWQASDAQNSGERGFWVERTLDDGPLIAWLDDLAPPRLRALMAMPEIGTVRFQLATERGSGARGLFDRKAPHLVDQLLPTLEAAASSLENFEIEAPEGWAENPWGAALDGLFEGPLRLDEEARLRFQRGLLPTPFSVLRAAVEQVKAWTEEGIELHEITLIHPAPESIGAFLRGLLEAEGLGMARVPGRSLDSVRPWTQLLALFEGLLAEDPQAISEGLLAAGREAWRDLAEGLSALDQTGIQAINTVTVHPSISEPWGQMQSLHARHQAPGAWAETLQRHALGLGMVQSSEDFYGIIGLLKEAWGQERATWTLADMLDALRSFLEVGTESPQSTQGGSGAGINLLSCGALLKGWEGARATLLLDLGEGVWPAQSNPPAELDWDRRAAINAALRASPQTGDFPPALQAFWLPRAEGGERLPRAFHREAFAFNTALALTWERMVALSSATDEAGQGRSQGLFWKALDGAGEWQLDRERSFTQLRHRWDGVALDGITSERQMMLRVQDPEGFPALQVGVPNGDLTPSWWIEGGSVDRPLSPTRLEALARCPFRVFAERGLRLSSWKSGKRTALDVGTVAHALMQRMLGGLENASHWPDAFKERHSLSRTDAWTLELLITDQWKEDGESILSALRDTPSPRDRERLRLAVEGLIPGLAATLAWDLAQAAPIKEECEYLGIDGLGGTEGTGGTEGDEEGWRRSIVGLEYEIPARDVGLELGLAIPLWIRGQVDRLERWERGRSCFLRVVDYKTSSRAHLAEYSKNGGLLGAHLQLPLYQWLVEQSFGLRATALLWPLKVGEAPLSAMFASNDEESRGTLRSHLRLLVERAMGGEFPAVPGDHCGTCSLSVLCGRPVDVEAVEGDETVETIAAGDAQGNSEAGA
ncbi:MAG: PD-(D/E)XK nuclease family protein [Holophagaceae bacterium]|nr:PD-(D/E)XK nuclease family protein [Holophagaceae bacterium]